MFIQLFCRPSHPSRSVSVVVSSLHTHVDFPFQKARLQAKPSQPGGVYGHSLGVLRQLQNIQFK